jgi:hypothetical protein
MSSMNQKIEHLGDHLPYEVLMLRHSYQRTLEDRHALDWNAFYEAFAVHARNLFDFLMNRGGSNNFSARDFSACFAARKDDAVERLINQNLNWQVFHFGKQRKSEEDEKVGKEQRKAVFEWIEENFNVFAEALDRDLAPYWYPERADPKKVHGELTKAPDTVVVVGLAPQSASTGSPQSASFTGPSRAATPPRRA